MQNPLLEIKSVASLLTAAVSPDIQNDAIRKYFTEDAGFRHPLCSVSPGPLSREDILGVYQWVVYVAFLHIFYLYRARWYRVMSPRIDIDITNVCELILWWL